MKYIIALCLISIILSGDIDASVKYLVENAQDESTGYCSKYVTDALEAGGFNPDRPPAAYQYWSEKRLEKIGYVEIDKPTSFNKGDITVTENTNGHEYGHIAMYSGDQWISDFKQNSEYVYREQPKVHYYRYVGTNEEIKKPKSQIKAVKPPVHKDFQPVKTIKRPIKVKPAVWKKLVWKEGIPIKVKPAVWKKPVWKERPPIKVKPAVWKKPVWKERPPIKVKPAVWKPPIKVKPAVWKPPIKVKPPVWKPPIKVKPPVIGKPPIHIGKPTVHIGKPTVHVGKPTYHIGNPLVHSGKPTSHSANPSSHSGKSHK